VDGTGNGNAFVKKLVSKYRFEVSLFKTCRTTNDSGQGLILIGKYNENR